MSWLQVQISHLIGVYCILIILGVFLKVHLPIDVDCVDSFCGNIPVTKETENQRNPNVQKMNYLTEIFKRTLRGDQDVINSSQGAVITPRDNVLSNHRRVFSVKKDNKDKPAPFQILNHQFAVDGRQKSSRRQPLKVSGEVNAFDDMVNMLTVSTTFCKEMESVKTSSDTLYHCKVKTVGNCQYNNIDNGIDNHKCKKKKTSGYDINPVDNMEVPEAKIELFTGNGDGIREKANVDKVEPYKITVNAEYSFLHELRKVLYMPIMRLDFELDLTGLNSLHKYEIISKFSKIMGRILDDGSYHLERSSADVHQLQNYLHQEGLHEPLQILTLWRRYS